MSSVKLPKECLRRVINATFIEKLEARVKWVLATVERNDRYGIPFPISAMYRASEIGSSTADVVKIYYMCKNQRIEFEKWMQDHNPTVMGFDPSCSKSKRILKTYRTRLECELAMRILVFHQKAGSDSEERQSHLCMIKGLIHLIYLIGMARQGVGVKDYVSLPFYERLEDGVISPILLRCSRSGDLLLDAVSWNTAKLITGERANDFVNLLHDDDETVLGYYVDYIALGERVHAANIIVGLKQVKDIDASLCVTDKDISEIECTSTRVSDVIRIDSVDAKAFDAVG
jgi:hypothetical protein